MSSVQDQKNEETSRVRDQKNCLEFKIKKRRKGNVSSLRPKNCLEFKTKKIVLTSRPEKCLEFKTRKRKEKMEKS